MTSVAPELRGSHRKVAHPPVELAAQPPKDR
jgi:hypothetical protein